MLIDAHIHSAGMSRCSRRKPLDLIAQCLVDKTDGFVLANHCDPSYTKELGWEEWCKKYNEEFYLTKEAGMKYNIKVFYGIEVETVSVKKVHYVIYGMTPDDLLKAPELYYLNQKELFEYCEANDFAFVQAHPYRNDCVPQNPAYLHGVEVSCHPLYKTTMSESVFAFAKQHGLLVTCGSDFHGDTYKPRCGMYIPDNITTEHEFKEFICKNQAELEIFEIVNTEYGPYHSWR
jgi:hypothetical protein